MITEHTTAAVVLTSVRARNEKGAESTRGHTSMDETALRREIREKMAAGALTRTPPPMMWAGPSSWKWKTCAACGERIVEGELEIEFLVCCDPIYFHPRCHQLWREECS